MDQDEGNGSNSAGLKTIMTTAGSEERGCCVALVGLCLGLGNSTDNAVEDPEVLQRDHKTRDQFISHVYNNMTKRLHFQTLAKIFGTLILVSVTKHDTCYR